MVEWYFASLHFPSLPKWSRIINGGKYKPYSVWEGHFKNFLPNTILISMNGPATAFARPVMRWASKRNI